MKEPCPELTYTYSVSMQKVEKRTKNITFYYILYELFYIFVAQQKT